MLEKPILSGRIGKWAYALIEYDLEYESLRAMRGQVIADFIVDHRIDDEENISYVSVCPCLSDVECWHLPRSCWGYLC